MAPVLLASRRGQIKRLAVADLRPCQRGDMGQIGLRFSQRDDALVALCSAASSLVAVTLGTNRSLRCNPPAWRLQACNGTGLQLALKDNQEVQALMPLHQDNERVS
jgi:DNA gyrase subunit A